MTLASLVLLLIAAPAGPAPRAPTDAADPIPANPVVKRGFDLWNAGDYAGAVAAWRAPADAGDADAQFNLGQAYKLGRGVPAADQRLAESWYRKAAEQGHDQAGGYLGLIMFQNGDRAGALPWLAKAADRGDPRAQYVYGTALFNGEQVPKDWPRAYAMMTGSAAAGLPQAAATLRQMDQFIPLPQRQQGLKLAAAMRAGPAPDRRPVQAATRADPPRPAAGPKAATGSAASAPRPAPATKVAAAKPLPAPKPASPAKATAIAPARGGGWKVQLGAYGNEPAARGAWTRLRGQAPALAALSPTYEKAGAVVRLKAGPLADRTIAARACTAAKAAGTACFPVAPQ